jgi:hypothetical protein
MKRRKLVTLVVVVGIAAGTVPHAGGDGVAETNRPWQSADTAELLAGWGHSLLRMLGLSAGATGVDGSSTAGSPPAPNPSEPPGVQSGDDGSLLEAEPVGPAGEVGPGWDPDG